MAGLPKVSELMRDREFWPGIADALHWERETLKTGRPYKLWMGEHSHLHSYTEIVLCIVGEHFYGVGGKPIKLSPGSAVLIPKQVLHDSWYSEHHEPCVDFWAHLLPHGHVGLNFIEHRPGATLSVTSVQVKDADFLADCQRACALLETKERSSRRTASFLFYLLHSLLEKLSEGTIAKTAADENAVIEHIKKHIAENLADRLPLDELARVAGYSPFHFHRIFTGVEKVTPRNFIETRRVSLACKLIEDGQTITSAALDAGFSTCSQFDRVFKKHMMTSPLHWIRGRKQ